MEGRSAAHIATTARNRTDATGRSLNIRRQAAAAAGGVSKTPPLEQTHLLQFQRLIGNQAVTQILAAARRPPSLVLASAPRHEVPHSSTAERRRPTSADKMQRVSPLGRKTSIQRMPVLHSTEARKEVRKRLVELGYSKVWDPLVTRIGSLTIRDHVGIDDLVKLLISHQYNVDLLSRVINIATPAELVALKAGPAHMRTEFGNLRLPSDLEVGRYYATYLAAVQPAYAPGMYDAFRDQMRANGGQYWDFAGNHFRRTVDAFVDSYQQAPTGGAPFCNQIYAGQNYNFAAHMFTPVPNWTHNPALATTRELGRFLVGMPPFNRPFTPQTRAAIVAVHAQPIPAQQILAIGLHVATRMGALLDAIEGAAAPASVLTVLHHVLIPPVGVLAAPNGFTNALNHLDVLAPAAPHLNPLTQHMPFGIRAEGLRGHFIKHPLGVQAPAHAANGQWEAQQWMTTLGLAPSGRITRGNFPGLVKPSIAEWEIFAQHSRYYKMYRLFFYNRVTPTSQPMNNLERLAMIRYLQAAGPGGPDAQAIAAAHERVYETYASNQFDASPTRYLYFDANNLKVTAMSGSLYMVAAWNGIDFDLSTAFMINGGAHPQFNLNLHQKIMNV